MLSEGIEILSNKHQIYSKAAPSASCSVQLQCSVTPANCIPGATNLSAQAVLTTTTGSSSTQSSAIGDWVVNWGDGTFETIEYDWLFSERTHIYSEFGDYNVSLTHTIEVEYCNGSTPDPIVIVTSLDCGLVTVGADNCPNNNCSTVCYNQEGHYKVRGELWFLNDIFGHHQVSKTTSYQYKNPWFGGWGWYKDKALVHAQLDYHFRAADCDSFHEGQEIDQAGNKKSIRAGKTHSGEFYSKIADGEVMGYNFLNNDSQNRWCFTELNVCD